MRQLFILILLVFSISSYSQTPTKAASNIVFTFTGCNEVEISWTNGNGSDRVVIMREGNAVSDVPEYNQYYTENPQFAQMPGSESIKNDGINWCVYRGPGNSVTVKNLKNLTKYCIAVFEYNGGGGIYDYKTDAYPAACVTTKNIVADFFVKDASGKPGTFYDTAQLCQQINNFKFINKSYSDITPMNYIWIFGDGDTAKGITDPTHKYKKPGLMIVKLIAMSKGCTTTVVKNDTVHPHPVAKFDLDPALLPKNDSVQCFFGNRYTFRNRSSLLDIGVGLSSMRYEWYDTIYNADTAFATAFKADRQFPTSGVKVVKLVVISNKGCRDSTYRSYFIKPRAIDPSKVILSPKAMCLNNNLFTFKNNSPNSISSSWLYNDSTKKINIDSSFLNPATYSFKKTGKYYITLRAYDNGGCLDQHTDSVNVFQNSNVLFTGLKDFYCLNDPPAVLVPTPPTKYGKFTGSNIEKDSVFRIGGIGKFVITYTSTIGCKESFKDSTYVHDLPIVELGPEKVICKDSVFQLSVDPLYTASWTANPVVPGVSGSGSKSVTITQSAIYSVKVTDEYGCVSSDDVKITVLTTPKIEHTRDTTLCGGSFLKFNLKVMGGTVTWDDGNTDGNRIVSTSGFKKVELKNKCGIAKDSFNLQVEETACIVFFPNAFTPNGDVLNDTWQPYGKYEFIQMNIYNRWGERVYFSDKSPIWDGYTNDKNLCLEGVFNCVFEYLMHEGNSMKRVTQGVNIHLIK